MNNFLTSRCKKSRFEIDIQENDKKSIIVDEENN